MKVIFFLFVSLFSSFSFAEESDHMNRVRRAMVSNGWETDDVTFEAIGWRGGPLLIKRSGKVVGYYCEESVWERRDVDVSGLKGVTKIVFGYDPPGGNQGYVYFELKDPDAIALWIASYQNQTEFESRFNCFVPTSKLAGFEKRRSQYAYGGAYGDTLGLRFYAGEKEVLYLKGHLSGGPVFNSGQRNQLLNQLVKSKIPKKPKLEKDAGGLGPFTKDDQVKCPFADEPEDE